MTVIVAVVTGNGCQKLTKQRPIVMLEQNVKHKIPFFFHLSGMQPIRLTGADPERVDKGYGPHMVNPPSLWKIISGYKFP